MATAPLGRSQRPTSQRAVTLSLAEYTCLALLNEAPTHGWSVARTLEEDGPIGRIWSLSRANTYRTIEILVNKGLVSRRPTELGGGANRVPLRVTAAGRRTVAHWLDEPILHVRHVRSELLVKLELRKRAGLDSREHHRKQRAALLPTIEAIMHSESPSDPVELWRREQVQAVLRFLDLLVAA